MPLNNAIYDSGRDIIFAIRGGYVYQMDSDTGAKVYFTMTKQGATTPQHIISKTTGGGADVVIDTGLTGALPFNIRYRSSNDRIYVPTWEDNSVVIIDPSSDTVETIKTGFDSPFDVVFTASKAFAVQHGSEGLKEIV